MSGDLGTILAALAGSYLLGSIPASFLIAYYGFGIDLRTVGSGNVGATNVLRAVGPRAGIPAAILDIGKGSLAVLLGRAVLPGGGPFGALGFQLLCGVCAVFGHTFTVFLRFKGGKGVATGTGVFLAVAPQALGCSFLVFVAVVGVTRYVSLGSILAALTLPVWIQLFSAGDRAMLMGIAGCMAAFIVFRHRANIGRLLDGTESKISFRGPQAAPSGPDARPEAPGGA